MPSGTRPDRPQGFASGATAREIKRHIAAIAAKHAMRPFSKGTMSDTAAAPRSELEEPIWAVVTSRDDAKMSSLTYEKAVFFAELAVKTRHKGVTITTDEAASRTDNRPLTTEN